MTRDAEKARDRHAASVRRYRDKVMREVLHGDRKANSIPKVNRKRKAKRAALDEVYGSYHRSMAELPCIAAPHGCAGKVCGHHLKSVGAGGKDFGNELPICAAHHTELHTTGRAAFERRYVVDLDAWARYLGRTHSEEAA